MRVQKFLSRAGVASRRKAETLVLDGRVRVNGTVLTELGTTVDPALDRVEVDGSAVQLPEARWIRFHKPGGVLCTAEDTHGRRTVYDVLPDEYSGLRYVGRLDLETEGLLLLTNDGEWNYKIMGSTGEGKEITGSAIRYISDEGQTHKWIGEMFIDGERLDPLRDTYRRIGD
jgi:23S rRNA pseudouridine2605 synthase